MSAFPTILLAVILYNLTVFIGMAMGHPAQGLLDQGFSLTMFSGDVWAVSVGDMFMFLSLGLLFVETVRAARSTSREILNHAFSMLTFCAALVEFIVLKGFSTTAFFMITAMCLFDVVAGYTISIVSARRDFSALPPEH